eukprot:c12829_g1_i1.p1 GENE.c12829_g1_i1~~c12829_g1_i1.p1  ORF type:complete len:154 (+),score=23.21 c12829_g1_i1:284-745(+)
MSGVNVPKIQTELLHDPVAEFVPEMDPEGDHVPELPGGLHRIVVPSPRGGFYANKVDAEWATKQVEEILRQRPNHSANYEDQKPATPKKDLLDDQFNQLLQKKPTREDMVERLVIKDSIDGITPRSNGSGGPQTPRRDRAYDALSSPRRVVSK